jgi:hypothetical protein
MSVRIVERTILVAEKYEAVSKEPFKHFALFQWVTLPLGSIDVNIMKANIKNKAFAADPLKPFTGSWI